MYEVFTPWRLDPSSLRNTSRKNMTTKPAYRMSLENMTTKSAYSISLETICHFSFQVLKKKKKNTEKKDKNLSRLSLSFHKIIIKNEHSMTLRGGVNRVYNPYVKKQ